MKRLFGRLGPRAYGYMKRKLPQAVAKVDAALGPAGLRAGAAGAGFNCRNLPSMGWKGFSETGPNGMKLDVNSNGKDLEVTLEADKDGKRFRIEFGIDGCTLMEPTPMPACPTAAGDLRGVTKLKVSIKVSLLEGGKVAERFDLDLDSVTKVAAKVGDDAKLDHMTIEDDQREDDFVPALIRGIFGPMSVHTKAHRTARVNMRTGAVEPGQSSVDVDATLGGLVGVFLGQRFREGAANRMKQESDRMFAATLQAAIDKLRERETAWQTAGACADLQFSPASGTLKLADGASGDFSGQVTTKSGTPTASGRWRRTGQQNATVTPDTATGGNPSFHYRVTRAGSGIKVTATFEATSPAGVAGGTWTQDTEGEILYLGEVSGTSSWDESPCPFESHEAFSYSAKLEKSSHTGGAQQPFPLIDDATLANPGVGLAAWGNDESGAGTWSSGPCETGSADCPGAPMTPRPDQGHGHVIFSVEGDTVKATARSFSWEVTSPEDCAMSNGIPVYGVGRFPVSDVGADTLTVPLAINEHSTEDGTTTDYVGSGTLTLHRVN
jgi:hypothetical protein